MRIGNLRLAHRFRRVTYTSATVAITGTLDYYQGVQIDGADKQVLTIGGWVSHPLDPDDHLEFHD